MFVAKIERVRFAGRGGQGLQTVTDLIGRALAMATEKFVSQSANYGPEARGGLSYSDLAVSDTEIDFPIERVPSILVLMSEQALDKFIDDLDKIKYLIVDPDMIDVTELKERGINPIEIPATRIAESLGVSRSANLVMLGAVLPLMPAIPIDLVTEAVSKKWPKFAEQNIQAIYAGMEEFKKVGGKQA